jgi:acyl-CoA thioester hydrolase
MELYPVVVQIPVAWGDMDAMQHVNNTAYFRYFESARVAYFGKLGLLGFKDESGIGVILASTNCRFRRALFYPDTVSAGARVSSIEDDSLVIEQALYSERLQSIAATSESLIVPFDYRQNKRVATPEFFRRKIEELERRGE